MSNSLPQTSNKVIYNKPINTNNRYVVVFSSIILYGCSMWLRSAFMPLTEALTDEFRLPPDTAKQEISKLAAAFFRSYPLTLLPAGLLLQILSSEILLIIPLIICGLCSLLIYTSKSLQQLITLRVVLGLSCSTCWLGTLSLIQQYFSLLDVKFQNKFLLCLGHNSLCHKHRKTP